MPLFGPPDVEKLKKRSDVKALIKALGYEDPLIGMKAEHALADLRSMSVGPLSAALSDRDPVVRSRAASVLGRIAILHGPDTTAAASDDLATALRDADESVRNAAAWALGRIGDQRAVEPLIAMLKAPDTLTRLNAAEILGMLGDPRAVEPLVELLNDPAVLGPPP